MSEHSQQEKERQLESSADDIVRLIVDATSLVEVYEFMNEIDDVDFDELDNKKKSDDCVQSSTH